MEEKLEQITKLLIVRLKEMNLLEEGQPLNEIPVGVSNRHVHLSQKDMDVLFGEGYSLTKIRDLSQPGQFACRETVTLCGAKGAIEKVRILGPVRSDTQVEILAGDTFKLGIKTEARLSGELSGTPGITLVGPKGSVQTDGGVIIAKRHIHMTLADAKRFGVENGQTVKIECPGERGGILDHVVIRANNNSALECHLDTEEANAMCLDGNSKIKIYK